MKVSGTYRQRKAAKIVSEVLRNNTTITKGQVLQQAGYSLEQSKKPQDVMQSQGFLVEMAKLGLTKEFVVSALQEDIALKPQRRAFELSIAGKWLGLEQRDTTPQTQTINNAIIVIQPPTDNDTLEK